MGKLKGVEGGGGRKLEKINLGVNDFICNRLLRLIAMEEEMTKLTPSTIFPPLPHPIMAPWENETAWSDLQGRGGKTPGLGKRRWVPSHNDDNADDGDNGVRRRREDKEREVTSFLR